MYLSSTDIQQTRLHTIDNLHLASRAWVDATEKLAELAMRGRRGAGCRWCADGFAEYRWKTGT